MKNLFGLLFLDEYERLKEKYNKMVKIIEKMIKDNDSIDVYRSEIKEFVDVFINHSSNINKLKRIMEEV